jgi:hypothetical protein
MNAEDIAGIASAIVGVIGIVLGILQLRKKTHWQFIKLEVLRSSSHHCFLPVTNESFEFDVAAIFAAALGSDVVLPCQAPWLSRN